LRLGPRVAPAKAVPPAKMLVEMVHVPAHVVRPVLLEHPVNLIHRNPLGRRFAKPLVDQPLKPFFFVALPIAPELPLRATQKLASLQRRQIPAFPSAQIRPETSSSCGPVARCPVHRPAPFAGHKTGQLVCYLTRTTRV